MVTAIRCAWWLGVCEISAIRALRFIVEVLRRVGVCSFMDGWTSLVTIRVLSSFGPHIVVGGGGGGGFDSHILLW